MTLSLRDAVLIAESVQLLNAGRPQAEVTAIAIATVRRKSHRESLPDDWRIAVEQAVAVGYADEPVHRPGTWRR